MKQAGMRGIVLAVVTVLCATFAVAQSDPAVGLWKNEEPNRTIFIRTYQENGVLLGKVEKLIKSGAEDSSGRCTKCQGDNKDKPVIGMTIIWDMKKDGARWDDGRILEPDTGKTYKCRIEAIENGAKLKVRGSFAFIGKTQTWSRVE